MPKETAGRLKAHGLDVEFLIWLEGEEDRAPRIDRLAELDGATLAAAVRGAVWLTSQWTNRGAVVPDEMDSWRERYEALQAFLWHALRTSMMHHRLDRPNDLEAVDNALDALLPKAAAQPYRDDIARLRKLGKPERLRDWAATSPKPRRGGRRQSEAVQRMRAAIEYLRTASKTPYRDLADLWNESLGESRYDADGIRSSLRKGQDAGPGLLAYWRRFYEGDPRAAFPGEFPQAPRRT